MGIEQSSHLKINKNLSKLEGNQEVVSPEAILNTIDNEPRVVDAQSEQAVLGVDLGENAPDGVTDMVLKPKEFSKAVEATRQFDQFCHLFQMSGSASQKVQVTKDLALAQSLIYIELLRQQVSRDIKLEHNMIKHLKECLRLDFGGWSSVLNTLGITATLFSAKRVITVKYDELGKQIVKDFNNYDEFIKFAEDKLDDAINNKMLYNLGLRIEPIHFPLDSNYTGGIHLTLNSRYIDNNVPSFATEPTSIQLKLENMNFELFYSRIISQYFSKIDKSAFNKSAFYSLLSLNKDLESSSKIVEQVISAERTFDEICEKLGSSNEIVVYVDKKELDTDGSKAKELYQLIFSGKASFSKLNMGILKMLINKEKREVVIEFKPFISKKGEVNMSEQLSLDNVHQLELLEKIFKGLNLIMVLTTDSSVFNDDRLITARYCGIIEDCIENIIKSSNVQDLSEYEQPLFKLCNKLVSQSYPIHQVHSELSTSDQLYSKLVRYIGSILYSFDYKDADILYDKIIPVMYNTLRMNAEQALEIIINISDTRLHDIAMSIFKSLATQSLRYANISKENSTQHNSQLAMIGTYRFYEACENALRSGALTEREKNDILELKATTTDYLSNAVNYHKI